MSEFDQFKSESDEAGTPPPAQESAAPAETVEAVTAEAPPVGEVEPAENKPVEVVTDEPSVEASATDAPSEEDAPSVKAQARKVWAEVNKMGGQAAFDAARGQFDAYFNKPPQEFVREISQYEARFYPVRDYLLHETAREFPNELVAILQAAHPDLNIQIGQQAQPAESRAQIDPVAYAREVLEDENATPYERSLAQHAITQADELAQAQAQLGKLPQLEEQVSKFSEFQTTHQQQQIAEARGKYVDELMESSVDRAYRESGLEGSPISLEEFREMVVVKHGREPEANARFLQAMDAIEAGDMKTAALLKEQIMRDGERIAFNYAKSFSAASAHTKTAKTQQLTKERPTPVPGGLPVGSAPPSSVPFDETRYAQGLADIKARG